MRKILLILSILLAINSTAQNKKSLLRAGNSLYADSSYNESEIQYRKSLEKDQNYFSASFNLADAIYKQERYSESSSLFDALKDNTKTNKDLTKVLHNLGNSLFKEQKLDEAIEAYKEALRINPNDNETRHNLALARKQKKQQEKNKEEEKKENKEEEKKENKEEEKKENKEEEKKEKKEEEKKEKKEEEKKEEMSKEDAEKMLEAIQQQEKELQEELQKKKVKGKKIEILKDW